MLSLQRSPLEGMDIGLNPGYKAVSQTILGVPVKELRKENDLPN